jgi:hypothetical protein
MKDCIIWKSYNQERSARLFGDQIMLDDVCNRLGFEQLDDFDQLEEGQGAIVTLGLEDNKDYIEQLNQDIAKLPWALIILTQNEYACQAYRDINHPNMKLWLQSSGKDDVADKFIGFGYPAVVENYYKLSPTGRDNKWFFSGQITHMRRKQAAAALKGRTDGIFIGTAGFNDGLDYPEYINTMARSKIVVCPAGPETPDTFRLYEALESGCIPIVDMQDGRGNYRGDYWYKVFGDDFPLVMVADWSGIGGAFELMLRDYDTKAKEVESWWLNYKQSFNKDLLDTVRDLKEKV